mmetsp:Transcript_102167/g.288589  ORF Transcript_102167/g.288589 Transcript_102167/m.288589 type:complete len:505 (+) Transcript_102167:102-1616(+)
MLPLAESGLQPLTSASFQSPPSPLDSGRDVLARRIHVPLAVRRGRGTSVWRPSCVACVVLAGGGVSRPVVARRVWPISFVVASARRSSPRRSRLRDVRLSCATTTRQARGDFESYRRLDADPLRSSVVRGAASLLPATFAGLAAARSGDAAPAADLRGRYGMVTGASKGIGKGIAIGLGECGATVFITGRSKALLEETASLVTQAGGAGVPLVCDHRKDDEVSEAFKEVGRQTGGTLDLLVNNAFQAPDPDLDRKLSDRAKFYELPISVWDDMHNVGLRSTYVASYYAAPLLLKTAATTGRRPLLCATSSFGAVSYLFTVAYGVGKVASDRLIRDLQVELGPQGVDCISLWPGIVLTEKIRELMARDRKRVDVITGGQDPELCCETPVLSGRVVAQLAANERFRAPPYITTDGLTGRVCIVAEAAHDMGLRDGGPPTSIVGQLYGGERAPAPSIRSLGFLGPGALRSALPENIKWLAEPGGLLANEGVKLPLEFMAQGPPPAPT